MGPDFDIGWISMAACTGPMAKQLAKELEPFRLMFSKNPS